METEKETGEESKYKPTPMFNSGQAYLERLDNLSTNFSMAMGNNQLCSAFDFLQCYYGEILPRFSNNENKIRLIERMISNINTNQQMQKAKYNDIGLNKFHGDIRKMIYKLFRVLSIEAHKQKLMMIDKPDETGGSEL